MLEGSRKGGVTGDWGRGRGGRWLEVGRWLAGWDAEGVSGVRRMLRRMENGDMYWPTDLGLYRGVVPGWRQAVCSRTTL